MPGLYFYFPPDGIRPVELITIESESSVFLRTQGDWVQHPHLAEVMDHLPELVVFEYEAQSAFDLYDLSERENRSIVSEELRPYFKLF
jgi:hypothetical protein